MKKFLSILFLMVLCLPQLALAQTLRDADGNELDENGNPVNKKNVWGRDSTNAPQKKIPMGLYMWRIDERLGEVIPMENDTMPHHFQNTTLTGGLTGQYNYLGNLGSPRLSRLFLEREPQTQFIFIQPFSYWYTRPDQFLFANTKSPITNISYFECGNKLNGEDRIRAYFASNINKRAGVGFKLDYLYGRGYYASQTNSMFNGTLDGYYLGDQYNMHTYFSANHMKMAENGGIEADNYITNPEDYSQSYGSGDIPTILTENWNRDNNQTLLFTHRYNVGFHRYVELPDSLKPKIPADTVLLAMYPDSIRKLMEANPAQLKLTLDSIKLAKSHEGVPREFVPVTSFIHTLKIDHFDRIYQAYATPYNYYTNHYYGDSTDIRDQTKYWSIKNTLGLSLREGFNKWAKAGLTAFATYEFRNYTLPQILNDSTVYSEKYKENNVTVGGQLSKTQGNLLHYNVVGDVVIAGADAGQFSVEGRGDLNFRLFKDTVQLAAHAYVKNLNPSFYFRHYHSQNTWWDNDDLSKEFRTRIEGALRLKRTRTTLTVGVENIKNYTYFAKELTATNDGSTYSQAVGVKQASGSIQVFSAKLNQNFRWGIFNWENEAAYQVSGDKEALPLPALSAYSNLFIKFRIAKVLLVELGADVRYFTSYYAPDYVPYIGSFSTQASENRIKIGNYPICNAYLNLHLKHCRMYLMGYHINNNSGNRRSFLVPHYPINPMIIKLGLSWNFFD